MIYFPTHGDSPLHGRELPRSREISVTKRSYPILACMSSSTIIPSFLKYLYIKEHLKTAFGRTPSLCLFSCGIKSLPNPWNNVVEAKHITKAKEKSWKFYSCACFTKEALRRLRFAFSIVHQWLMWLFSLTLLVPWAVY